MGVGNMDRLISLIGGDGVGIRCLACAYLRADWEGRDLGCRVRARKELHPAERFGVSVSSAVRWHQLWRHEGTIEAKPYGGSRSPLEDHAEELLAVIEEQPDLTLDEIVAVMRKRQIPGSRTALFRFLERHAVTSKKSPSRCRTGADGRGSPPPAMDTRAGLA